MAYSFSLGVLSISSARSSINLQKAYRWVAFLAVFRGRKREASQNVLPCAASIFSGEAEGVSVDDLNVLIMIVVPVGQ